MVEAVLTNPIWWGQFRLQGGARKVELRTVIYAAFLVLVFLAACRLARPMPVSLVAFRALYVVGFAQLVLLLPVWSIRIHKAVLNDTTSNMIESHRLSSMSGIGAVLGYLLGPNLQVLCLVMVNLVGGVVLCVLSKSTLAGSLVANWTLAHVYVFFVAAFVWSGALLGSFCFGKRASLITVLFVMLFMGGWRVVELIPGLGLICGTEMIGYCYGVATGSGPTGLPAGAALSIVVQIAVMLLWLRAAAGKFERPDLPAFSVLWASVFFVGWLSVATVGLARAAELRLPFLVFEIGSNWQLVGTLVISLLFLFVPARSSAVFAQRWHRQHRELAGAKPLGPLFVTSALALGVAVLIAGFPLRLQFSAWLRGDGLLSRMAVGQWLWTTTSMVLTGLTLAALYRLACASRMKNIDVPVILYVLLVWAALPIFDTLVEAYFGPPLVENIAPSGVLTACSPVGGLGKVWHKTPEMNTGGLLFQATLCCLLVGLQFWVVRRSVAHPREPRV